MIPHWRIKLRACESYNRLQLQILVRAIHAMDPFHFCCVKTPIASLCFITVGIQIYIRTRLVFSTVSEVAYDKITGPSILIKKIPFKLAIFVTIVASLTYGVLKRFLSMVYYDVWVSIISSFQRRQAFHFTRYYRLRLECNCFWKADCLFEYSCWLATSCCNYQTSW